LAAVVARDLRGSKEFFAGIWLFRSGASSEAQSSEQTHE